MARLWEREVGRLPPRRFAGAVMASEVRHSRIQEGGCVFTDKLASLTYMVTQLAVQPGSHAFFCCVVDGSVWHFDLREKNPRKLFKCGAVRSFDYLSGETMKLYAIAVDPRNSSCFAVSGNDEYVRLYDTRKIDLERSKFGLPVEQFCPQHLIFNKRDGITGLAFSQTGELLASYLYDNIYLFSKEHGLHYNDFSDISVEKLPLPRTFKGHQNKQVIKGVNFLGPNCDYVTSGSDCGHVFIWRKKDGELMRVMKGDKQIVNCVEQHPTEIVVASCGIDADVKIWAPGDSDKLCTTSSDEVDSHDYMISACYDSTDEDDEDGDDYDEEDEDVDFNLDDDETDGDEAWKDDEPWRYMTAK